MGAGEESATWSFLALSLQSSEQSRQASHTIPCITHKHLTQTVTKLVKETGRWLKVKLGPSENLGSQEAVLSLSVHVPININKSVKYFPIFSDLRSQETGERR